MGRNTQLLVCGTYVILYRDAAHDELIQNIWGRRGQRAWCEAGQSTTGTQDTTHARRNGHASTTETLIPETRECLVLLHSVRLERGADLGGVQLQLKTKTLSFSS